MTGVNTGMTAPKPPWVTASARTHGLAVRRRPTHACLAYPCCQPPAFAESHCGAARSNSCCTARRICRLTVAPQGALQGPSRSLERTTRCGAHCHAAPAAAAAMAGSAPASLLRKGAGAPRWWAGTLRMGHRVASPGCMSAVCAPSSPGGKAGAPDRCILGGAGHSARCRGWRPRCL